jgi:hypothetical protein
MSLKQILDHSVNKILEVSTLLDERSKELDEREFALKRTEKVVKSSELRSPRC